MNPSNASTPIIVQGTAVTNPNQFGSGENKNPYHNVAETNPHSENLIGNFNEEEQNTIQYGQQQQQQPKQYKDGIWAVAFIVHLLGMFVLIGMNVTVNEDGGDGGNGIASVSFLLFLAELLLLSAILSSFTISLMMKFPTEMIKVALIFSTVLLLLISISGFIMGDVLSGGLCLFFFVITCCYVKAVWCRIPFAATNLNTALTAIRSNMGLAVIAYIMMFVAFSWSCFWLLGFANLLSANNNPGLLFLLLLSFYWVQQVLSNTVHVTTAGTVGTWWFVPGEANGCWSSAIRDSFCRATSYSFGSICLGSLVVAVVQALRALSHQARQNEDCQILFCLVECILACIQDIVEYFNKWAYVYVGLYGFDYVTAGKNVIQLFQQKGWTVIIADDLTDRVLMMVSMCVGIITGLTGLALSLWDPNILGLEENSGLAGFFVGFVVGFLFCSILMSIVGSAINTVIVCFAESPAEFEANHSQLSAEMRSSWMSAWPELSI